VLWQEAAVLQCGPLKENGCASLPYTIGVIVAHRPFITVPQNIYACSRGVLIGNVLLKSRIPLTNFSRTMIYMTMTQ